ncbi:hypothetical protein FRC10_006847 [Ceratobasidium sp. 414]|nr:hypothetical protein FRC10_006847 [Ceratobasidium sp. 414]
MSKRKVAAGGYDDSSDKPDITLDPLSKRSRSAPYAPARLTASLKLGLGAFQLPGSSASSTRNSIYQQSSGWPTPAPENIQTARNTPDIQISPDPEPRSMGVSPVIPTDMSKSVLDSSTAHKQVTVCSTLLLERQMNDLTGSFEEYKSASEEQHKYTDDTLVCILDAVHRLSSNPSIAPQAPLFSTSSPVSETKPFLSNPTPAPDLIAIVSKVVAEARGRVGKKKGGPDENSCKEFRLLERFGHILKTIMENQTRFQHSLLTKKHDTAGPTRTGKCRSQSKSHGFQPTSSGSGQLSPMIGVLILLNDRPFKSAQTAWRDMKKTDHEVEAMRSSVQRYQRGDRKASVRAAHIKTVPSLQGPEWEYLSQPGYMSQDESNEEGGLITKRPEHRSRWETNLYDTISVAERMKARARPGLCPHLPPRRVEIVKHPIPLLERGTGGGKVTI